MTEETSRSRRDFLKLGAGVAAVAGAGAFFGVTRDTGTPDLNDSGEQQQNRTPVVGETLLVEPEMDLSTAIDGLDGGRIVLETGEHQLSEPIRVPGNVVIEGQGSQSVIRPTTDTDMFLIGGEWPEDGGNSTALRNLVLDTSGLGEYTSTAVTFADSEVYQGGVEFLQDVMIYMANNGRRGTGIGLVDDGGTGISYVSFGNVRIMFPDVAIYVEVNGDGFVNGNASRNIWVKQPRVGIQEVVNSGVIRSNSWDLRLNGESSVEHVLQNQGDRNRYQLFAFDLARIDGPAIVVEGDQNLLVNQGGSNLLWRWVADSGIGNQYQDQSTTATFLAQGTLPYWLETAGDGQLVHRAAEARLAAGSSTGDEFAISAPQRQFYCWQYPWMSLWFDFADAPPNGLVQIGFEFGDSDGDGAYLIADPHDALGTGMTDQFLTSFHTESGPSIKQTGVGLDSDSHTFGLRTIAGDGNGTFDMLWALDGERVRFYRGFDNRDLTPRVSVRKTGRGQAVVHLEKEFELRYAEPR